MQSSRQLLIRGLEHLILLEFNDTYDGFNIRDIFTIYTEDIDVWYSSVFIQRTIDVGESDERIIYFDLEEASVAPPYIFHKALEYCSLKARAYSQEINYIFFIFTVLKDVQWAERQLCNLLIEGIKPEVPFMAEMIRVKEKRETRKKRQRVEPVSVDTPAKRVAIRDTIKHDGPSDG